MTECFIVFVFANGMKKFSMVASTKVATRDYEHLILISFLYFCTFEIILPCLKIKDSFFRSVRLKVGTFKTFKTKRTSMTNIASHNCLRFHTIACIENDFGVHAGQIKFIFKNIFQIFQMQFRHIILSGTI